jgi:hypothetical protein
MTEKNTQPIHNEVRRLSYRGGLPGGTFEIEPTVSEISF